MHTHPIPRRRLLMTFAILVSFVIFNTSTAQGQGLIKTMLEQIAKLEITLQEAKQGYDIVKKGLNVIGDIKKGDFDLHNNYFASLSSVKGPIKNYSRVADIIRMQLAILNDCRSTVSKLTPTGLYTSVQLAYCSRVFVALAEKTGLDMDELADILSDGHWQMNDEDRLSRIDVLYKRVEEKYRFCKSFSAQTKAIGARKSLDLQSYSNLDKIF